MLYNATEIRSKISKVIDFILHICVLNNERYCNLLNRNKFHNQISIQFYVQRITKKDILNFYWIIT